MSADPKTFNGTIDAAPCILWVDDETAIESLVVQRFRHKIVKAELRFRFATTMAEARRLIPADPGIKVVMCDINLGDGNGIDLLNEIKQSARDDLVVVMATAYGDIEHIRRCMNLGAFDFVLKPFDFQDVERTIANAFDYTRRIGVAKAEHIRLADLDRELELARQLQQSFIPPPSDEADALDRAHVYGIFRPSSTIGGDFYDYFQPDRNTLVFVLGDVSGSGVAGAMWMGICHSLLRAMSMLLRPFDPGRVLKTVNTLVCERNKSSFFISLFLGMLDLRLGTLSYCNAGQCLPFLIHAGGKVEALPQNGGMVIGVDVQKDYEPTTLSLQNDETLVLFTDGISEARNIESEEFGAERVAAHLSAMSESSLPDLCTGLVNAVDAFMAHDYHADDMTIFALRYRAGEK